MNTKELNEQCIITEPAKNMLVNLIIHSFKGTNIFITKNFILVKDVEKSLNSKKWCIFQWVVKT